tara:strand:- start:429 stop:845 length:417 start_codon:yes stop_codon:yes gene_type:complete
MTVFFTEINDSNIVINATVWEDSILGDPASEENGKNYLANVFSVSADKFVQTFEDGTRKQFASVNFIWDPANNVFIIPKPFDSWTLDGNYDWQPPVANPNTAGYKITWDEDAVTWNGLKTADNSEWIWNTVTNQWDSV